MGLTLLLIQQKLIMGSRHC